MLSLKTRKISVLRILSVACGNQQDIFLLLETLMQTMRYTPYPNDRKNSF